MAAPRVPATAIHAALPDLLDLEFIDNGTQGDAWRVRRPQSEVNEVLKVIVAGEPSRIAREIDTMRQVSSPHVMKFAETGVLEHDGERYAFIVGEYVPGRSIAARIRAADWPTESQALAATVGMLRGIDAMHDREKVHRDVKPANVALRDDDWTQPVILDLGLVRDLLDDSITAYPNVLGTVPFMAPEQLRRERAVKRSDVFAAGVTLFLLLTRELPFAAAGDRGVSLEELDERVNSETYPRWADHPKTIAEDVREVLARMLRADAFERPRAATAALALESIARERSDS